MTVAFILATSVLLIILGIQGWALIHLNEQHGRLSGRLDMIAQHGAPFTEGADSGLSREMETARRLAATALEQNLSVGTAVRTENAKPESPLEGTR